MREDRPVDRRESHDRWEETTGERMAGKHQNKVQVLLINTTSLLFHQESTSNSEVQNLTRVMGGEREREFYSTPNQPA